MRWTPFLAAVAVAGSLTAGPVRAAPRKELEQLRRQMETALQQGASLTALLGESRAYYVRGEGALLALAPRALPRGHEALVFHALPGPQPPGKEGPEVEPVPQEIAEQMAAMEREAEQARQEAERAFEQVRRQIRLRVGNRTAPLPPPPAEEPAVPPPWRFWFQIGETGPPSEPVDPAPLLREAREKVTDTLIAHPPVLEGLAPEEFLAVAVDFVTGSLLVPDDASERTLMIRVRKRDLDALRSGRIDTAEFRSRVAYDEY